MYLDCIFNISKVDKSKSPGSPSLQEKKKISQMTYIFCWHKCGLSTCFKTLTHCMGEKERERRAERGLPVCHTQLAHPPIGQTDQTPPSGLVLECTNSDQKSPDTLLALGYPLTKKINFNYCSHEIWWVTEDHNKLDINHST